MSVLAVFGDTFVCKFVRGPEAENKAEEIGEVGIQWIFSEVMMRWQSLHVDVHGRCTSQSETNK